MTWMILMRHSTTKPTKAVKWKIIPGFDGLYRVSNYGDVQSCHKYGSRTGERGKWRSMKFYTNHRGYVSVGFGPHENRRSRFVHRLVAIMFVKNPLLLNAVNHIDGDKSNNKALNLEWCTNKQNTEHAIKTGLIITGSKHPHCCLTPNEVIMMRDSVGTYVSIGKQFGVSAATVLNVKKRYRYADVI